MLLFFLFKMFIRQLDYLSPSITLYYKGEETHSSIVSGLLTLIVFIICCIFGLMYLIRFIKGTNPQAYYYNRFVEEAGTFPVNASSMFAFVQILDKEKNVPDIIDFDMVTIIGIQLDIGLYQKDNDLSKYDHWIYGPCNNSSDTEGISHIITADHFTESACIRQYYNKDDNKYYDTKDENFKWPMILHGCGNPKRTFYGIILEKCRNTTLRLLSNGKFCKPQEDIIEYMSTKSVWLKIIDHYADMFNFENPFTKYLYSVSNGLFEETYTVNHLNFNPATLISEEGIFLSNEKESLAYLFDVNEKTTASSLDSGIYVAYYYWMQRRMQYYERVYEKFQDALSNIGGFFSIFFTAAQIINFLISKYIILFDMNNYMNEIDNKKLYKSNINSKSQVDVKNNMNKLFPPKRSYYKQGVSGEGIDIFNKNIKIIRRNRLEKNPTALNNNIPLNNNQLVINENNPNLNRINRRKTHISRYMTSLMKEKTDSRSTIVLRDRGNHNIGNNGINNNVDANHTININNEYSHSNNVTFSNYFCYLIPFKDNSSNNIKLYADFRIKMISEENLILSNLNVDKLMEKYKNENDDNNQESEATQKNDAYGY